MTRRKFAASPLMPALARMAPSALRCSSAPEHRAAHQAIEVGAVGDQRVELFEIGFDRVERLVFERELEQRRRITACHTGNG